MGDYVVVSVRLPARLLETLRRLYCDKRGLDNSRCLLVVVVKYLDALEEVRGK